MEKKQEPKTSESLLKHQVSPVGLEQVVHNADTPNQFLERMGKYTRLGSELVQNNAYPEANLCFMRAIMTDPNDFFAYYYLGCINHEHYDNIPHAILLYTHCLEQAPKEWSWRPGVLVNLASCEFKVKNYQSALEKIDEALAADPNLINAYLLRAVHYAYTRDYEKALMDTRQVKERATKTPAYVEALRIELDIFEKMGIFSKD